MSKPLEFKVTLHDEEDPELVALLRPLGRYERARVARRLMRCGAAASVPSAVDVAPAAPVRPAGLDGLPDAFDPAAFTFGKS